MPAARNTDVPRQPTHRNHSPQGALLLGLDVGTTTCKAAVFDLADTAEPIAVYRTPSATRSPRPGWSEADPEQVLAAVFDCVRAVVAEVPAERITALGVSGTACGAWLIDQHGSPVRPAVLWNDGRAADLVDRWRSDGVLEEIFDRSGNVLFPGYTVAVLRWLRDNEPASLAASSWLLACKDWIRFRLTGEITADETDASYVPFDVVGRKWDTHLMQLAGVEDHLGLFPPIASPLTTHPLLASVADELGLPAGIPVALGATDIIAGLVGAGALDPGQAVTILGTSANSSLLTAAPQFSPRLVGIMAAAPLGRFARTMINTSGSSTLDWMARLLTSGDVPALIDLAAKATDDCPVLLPYLANAGVISPFVDAHARGVVAGLRVDHGPSELALAAVQGLAFAVADCYAAMPSAVVELTAVGGAARSDLLLQTIADATGASVARPAGEEFGSRGVALLAAFSAGLLTADELRTTAAATRIEARFNGSPERVQAALERYRAVRDATREIGRQW